MGNANFNEISAEKRRELIEQAHAAKCAKIEAGRTYVRIGLMSLYGLGCGVS